MSLDNRKQPFHKLKSYSISLFHQPSEPLLSSTTRDKNTPEFVISQAKHSPKCLAAYLQVYASK